MGREIMMEEEMEGMSVVEQHIGLHSMRCLETQAGYILENLTRGTYEKS